MTIEILPAQLANQIAAGEVVERPASVIKELVENSLDAGATQIHIDVEKGGIKKLRICDNGSGIVKDELTLALSRHATSKIKNLNDLEGIGSLGFRGEALASISSVSRLTLTSKPPAQESAWQATAAGRDMNVVVQPAAHPNGTTIEVKDLFFNTPARRKFLRTDKTEFSHIDEVVKRIALARFDVAFTLTHNGKIVRQYRASKDQSQYAKRVAMVCGKRFIDEAIEVDCHHDNLHLWGWLAKPSFSRSQNDLCYSYVNGRMMRDKLINHAIRQSYAELISNDQYPAFVLFLTLDYREVDVNVHPAKHEVRFHQSRFIHDFIFSVCNNALSQAQPLAIDEVYTNEHGEIIENFTNDQLGESNAQAGLTKSSGGTSRFEGAQTSNEHNQQRGYQQAYQQREEYVTSLRSVNDGGASHHQPNQSSGGGGYNANRHAGHNAQYTNRPSVKANQAYQQLMTTERVISTDDSELAITCTEHNEAVQLLNFVAPSFNVIILKNELRLLSLAKLAQQVHYTELIARQNEKMVSQPLLLPVMLECEKAQRAFIKKYQEEFEYVGIVVTSAGNKVQIREFPVKLRDKNISASFSQILQGLYAKSTQQNIEKSDFYHELSLVMLEDEFTEESARLLYSQASKIFKDEILMQLALNSVVIDLTSSITLLNSLDE